MSVVWTVSVNSEETSSGAVLTKMTPVGVIEHMRRTVLASAPLFLRLGVALEAMTTQTDRRLVPPSHPVKCGVRPCVTFQGGLVRTSRIESVAQAISQEVERQQGSGHERCREEQQPPFTVQ